MPGTTLAAVQPRPAGLGDVAVPGRHSCCNQSCEAAQQAAIKPHHLTSSFIMTRIKVCIHLHFSTNKSLSLRGWLGRGTEFSARALGYGLAAITMGTNDRRFPHRGLVLCRMLFHSVLNTQIKWPWQKPNQIIRGLPCCLLRSLWFTISSKPTQMSRLASWLFA